MRRLFLIAELEDQDVACARIGTAGADNITLGGLVYTKVAEEEGETHRWTRTDTFILRDPEGRHWSLPYESNPSDHDGGADGFRSHPADYSNPIHVEGVEVRPVEKTTVTITWETVK
jgi:hypothetical protein